MRVRVAERLRRFEAPRPGTFLDHWVQFSCRLWPPDEFISAGESPVKLFEAGIRAAADIAESIAHAEPPTPAKTHAPYGPFTWCAGCAAINAATIAEQIREDRKAMCR